jgi:hypothetical protein
MKVRLKLRFLVAGVSRLGSWIRLFTYGKQNDSPKSLLTYIYLQ